MRRICESCEMGYAPTAAACPWCGCTANLSHTSDTTSCLDTECYTDYWLCMFETGEVFQLAHDIPLDIPGLRTALSRYRIVTFNGLHYDFPIIALALQGATTHMLKAASTRIIDGNEQPWHITDDRLDWVDHIDLFNVAPGMSSLKAYGAKMHSRKLQDLPIHHNASIRWCDRVVLREYCRNDLQTTRDLLDWFPSQIKMREEMSVEYGVDLRSKSDPQIAEAAMKSMLPFKVQIPPVVPGEAFYYKPPTWMKFQHLDVLERIVEHPFYINHSGGVAAHIDNHLIDWSDKAVRLDHHGKWVTRPAGWVHRMVTIGETSYTVGTGGLHSTEANILFRETDTHRLISPDVASYYPSLIVNLGIFPRQIGEIFRSTYRGWYDTRLDAKAKGIKKLANSLKTLLNGVFGKLGSMWSIFFAPKELIQVTITGQLALLMLIEMMETCGIPVVSANTDGIVVNCPRSLEPIYRDIITWWEQTTGFVMEDTYFRLLASRDVNSYISITTDGETKLKGAFAPAEPGPSGWPNPTGQICVDAVVAYLRDGVPLDQTIRNCTDVRQFIYARSVKGGGSYLDQPQMPRSTTQKHMRAVLESVGYAADLPKDILAACYADVRERTHGRAEYLGKVVRWYYATGSTGCILTPEGGLVPRSEGCRPIMTLPDEMPCDIDYQWYIDESASILRDIGVTK